MFLHGEDIASITNTVQMQECKNAKMQRNIVLAEYSHDIIFAFLHFLCKKIHTTHSRKFTAPAPEKQALWRGSKFSLAMQKKWIPKGKNC